jgi:hypothetical protein
MASNSQGQTDIYASGFSPTQTVELQSMFQKCGFSGADWIDIPAWLMFSVSVPYANGGLLANQKQSVGSAQGADFYLRRIQQLGFYADTPQVFARIKLPTGRYLQGGNSSGNTTAVNTAGVLTPGPLGLVKPEVRCPAGSNFTIDLLNVTPTYSSGVDVVISLIFEGVYRFRLEKAC